MFFFTEQVTHGARSVRIYMGSEPKTKTAAELRVHLHQQKVIKFSYDHLLHANHGSDLPQIFEGMDCMCSP